MSDERPSLETIQIARSVMGDSISEEEAVAMARDAEAWMDRVCELHQWDKGRLVTAFARTELEVARLRALLREIREELDQEADANDGTPNLAMRLLVMIDGERGADWLEGFDRGESWRMND